ncbi:MAG: adenylate/guanylate cyclase domain-containing protein, partial [Hormoscilla sp.]
MKYLISNPDNTVPETSEQKIYQLQSEETNRIGRVPDNNIVVKDSSMSRYHAEIAIAADGVASIKDLDSKNRTFVNEVPIKSSPLKDGDLVRCGNVAFKFVDEDKDQSDGIIVTRLAPEKTSTALEELLYPKQADKSVLMLRDQDPAVRAENKLKILLEVSKQLSSPEEPDRLLEKILDLLFEIMNVDRGSILMVNEKTGQLELKKVKVRSGITANTQFYSKRIANGVLDRGEAILISDACQDSQLGDAQSILQQNIHASMCVPLKPREKTIGVLYVDNLSMSNIYSQEDLEFLTGMANTVAIAIENSQLYQKNQAEAVMRDRLEHFFPKAVTRKIREEGELKIVDTEVTAMFADISSFTQMSSTMEPRQIIEMLNEYFTIMVEEIVFKYEGTLEKYIGDALLAVWGAPYRQPDDADRALNAACEMQRALTDLNRKWQQQGKRQISIHIGLNTGKVASGNIGSQKLIQYAHIGDTTNVTSRICSVAEAGEIVISQSTLDKLT